MADRTNAEMALVDGMTAEPGGPRTAALLARLQQTVRSATLAVPIVALPEYQRNAGGGHAARGTKAGRRVRKPGRRRNEPGFALTPAAYNWKRSLSLAKAA